LKNNTKKKKNSVVYAAIIVGILVVSSTIFFVYSNDQAKLRGQMFGNELKQIQDDLKKNTHSYDSKLSLFKEGNLDREKFLEFAEKHKDEMSKIILRYDSLQIPNDFKTAVDLFKLSSETQLESDILIMEWVKTGNDAAHIRSDALLQESFDYEMAALAEYKLSQVPINP
jgi:hypothetical protein